MYDSETGNKLKSDAGEYPVIDGNTFYFSGKEISASVLNSKNSWKPYGKLEFQQQMILSKQAIVSMRLTVPV